MLRLWRSTKLSQGTHRKAARGRTLSSPDHFGDVRGLNAHTNYLLFNGGCPRQWCEAEALGLQLNTPKTKLSPCLYINPFKVILSTDLPAAPHASALFDFGPGTPIFLNPCSCKISWTGSVPPSSGFPTNANSMMRVLRVLEGGFCATTFLLRILLNPL